MSKSNPVPTYNFPKGIPNPDTLQKVGLSRVFTAIQFVILIVYPFIVIMGQGIDDVKHPLISDYKAADIVEVIWLAIILLETFLALIFLRRMFCTLANGFDLTLILLTIILYVLEVVIENFEAGACFRIRACLRLWKLTIYAQNFMSGNPGKLKLPDEGSQLSKVTGIL